MVEDLTGLSQAEAAAQLKEQGLTAQFIGSGDTVTGQIPAAGQIVPGGSQLLVYMGQQAQTRMVSVPDFTGMNRQQASDAAGKLGLYILVTGNSAVSASVTVTSQSVPAGTEIAVGTTITLEFTDTAARD